MLSCMNVKSLQASSTHPRRGDTSRGILDERAYFSPPSSHSPRFLVSLFSSCPPSLGSPEVSPLTDPLYVRGRKRENTNVGFRRKKKTDGCSTSLNICSFSAGDSNSLLLFLFLCCSWVSSSHLGLKVWHVFVLLASLCFSLPPIWCPFEATELRLAPGATNSEYVKHWYLCGDYQNLKIPYHPCSTQLASITSIKRCFSQRRTPCCWKETDAVRSKWEEIPGPTQNMMKESNTRSSLKELEDMSLGIIHLLPDLHLAGNHCGSNL